MTGVRYTFVTMALFFLTGCGGTDSSPIAAEAPSSEVIDSSSESTPSEPVATNQQYASIVARNAPDLRDLIHDLDLRHCDWLGSGRLDREPGLFGCELGIWNAELSAGILRSELGSAADDVGAPPDELAGLVESTIEAARTVEKTARKAYDRDCGDTGRGECGGLRIDVHWALGDLESELDAWAPYL